MALTATNVAELFFAATLQYFLLKIHLAKNRPGAPTSFETSSLVFVAWIFYEILESSIWYLVGLCILLGPKESTTAEHVEVNAQSSSAKWELIPVLNVVVQLLHKTWVNWIIFRSLVILFDTIIPNLQNVRQDPETFLLRFQARCVELFHFFQTINKDAPEDASEISQPITKFGTRNEEAVMRQAIDLERQQIASPTKEERILSWNLFVDKKALDEMKETLGPPGGFGELGFNVAKDQVCFEAMGIGTRFNLTFELDKRTDERAADKGESNWRTERRRRSRIQK
jgi:hypothetical protein